MSADPTDHDGILEEVPVTASQGVDWNWILPHNVWYETVKQNGQVSDPLAESKRHSGKEERDLGEKRNWRNRSSPGRKTKPKTYSKLKNQHKIHASTTQSLLRRADEQLPLVKYRQSPRTVLIPNFDAISIMLPCNIPDDILKPQLHRAAHTLADMVSSGSSSTIYAKSFAVNVMSSFTVSPALLHSVLFAQILYDRVQQGVPHATPIELEIGANAVKHLNREISGPKQAVTDSNIWSVVCLAYSGRAAVLQSRLQHPRQTFLKELQSLHIYSRMEVVVEHVLGLIKMIEHLGGLHKIKTPGIAQVISFAGLIAACRGIGKPIFPFIPHTETFIQNGELNVTAEEIEAVASDLGSLGTGFWDVWNEDSPPEILDLSEVIRDACCFTIVVENYVRGRWMQRTSTEILDQRNYIQHSLMSLRTSQELRCQGIRVNDLHYESCRLATIIYSFLVVFPVPPIPGPFETVTHLLQQELEKIHIESLEMPRLTMHLWTLVMGAIACIGLSERSWFVSKIAKLSQIMEIREWQDLHQVLRSYLWHPGTSNADGIELWDEVEEEIYRNKNFSL